MSALSHRVRRHISCVAVAYSALVAMSIHASCTDMGFKDKYIYDFYGDIAAVRESYQHYVYITRSGEPLNNQWYEEAGPFSDGLAMVCYQGQYYFINRYGEEAFPGRRFDFAFSYSYGLTWVRDDGRSYWMNTKGEEAPAPF